MVRAFPPFSRASHPTARSSLFLLLLLAFLSPRAAAMTGRLVVLLEGSIEAPVPPTLILTGRGQEESHVLGALEAAAGRLVIENLTPGVYRASLAAGAAAPQEAARIDLGIHEGRTTLLRLDLTSGRMWIDAFRPDPFGVDDAWDGEWLAMLPGSGEEAARQVETASAPPRQFRVEDFHATGSGFRYPQRVGGEAMSRSVNTPLGVSSASEEGSARSLLARTCTAYADLEGATGDFGRGSWEGTVGRSFPRTPLAPQLFLSVRALQHLDAAPSVFETDRLPHNGLESLELLSRVDVEAGAATDVTALFYGEGNNRKYFLESYRYDAGHSPREDRAAIQAALRATHALRPDLRLLGEILVHRTFLESGDGEFFDNLRAYGSPGNAPSDDFGLYWRPGHVYDHFFRKVHLEATARLELWKDPGTSRRLGAGLWIRRGDYRSYEHLRPTLSYLGEEGGGYNLAQSIGYDVSGSSRASQKGSEPGRPLASGGFATLRRGFAGGEIEAGARATFYRSGQEPLRDLSSPVDEEGNLGPAGFGEEKTRWRIDPRLGFTRGLGPGARLWLTGGSETWLPPAEAASFSPAFLERMAATVDPQEPLRMIFGNPALEPERAWIALAAIGVTPFRGVQARLGVEGRRIEDAITARAVPVGGDSLVYYVNDGVRDLVDLALRAAWEINPYVRAQASYDLSESRTESVEPTLLDAASLAPDLPTRGENLGEGLPFILPPYDDGRDHGFFPSLGDRRHRLSFAAMVRTDRSWIGDAGSLFEDFELGALVRAASGAPFTWTQVYPAGRIEPAVATPASTTGLPRNDGRLPWSAEVDLRLARSVRLFGIEAQGWIEVRNLTDRRNEVRVYQATGEAEDDGWLASTEGRQAVEQDGEELAEAYRARIRDPYNFGEPRLFRIGLRLRMP